MFYYCGIDIAKHQHAVVLLDEHGQKTQPVFAVQNTRGGLDQLEQELAKLDGTVMVGLEATGHYWLSLYDELTRQGYAVVVINPLQVAAYRKSGVRKVKTDKTDAVWIADFLRIAHLPATSRDIPALLQLRELSRFRYWLSDQIGDCKRKLLTILDRVFPEYESLFSNVFIQSSRALLQEAVSAQEFASFDLNELTQLLHRSSHGRFGAARRYSHVVAHAHHGHDPHQLTLVAPRPVQPRPRWWPRPARPRPGARPPPRGRPGGPARSAGGRVGRVPVRSPRGHCRS